MELEELKGIWNSAISEGDLSPGGLPRKWLKSSKSIVSRMQRNLRFEMILVLISYSATIYYYFHTWNGSFQKIAWFMLFTGLFFLCYYAMKYRLLSKMDRMETDLKKHTLKQIRLLEKYTRFYLIAGTAVIPVAMLFFGWLIVSQFRGTPEETSAVLPREFLVTGFSLIGITTIIAYFLNRWYIRRLYGHHIDHLKQIFRDMSDDRTITG